MVYVIAHRGYSGMALENTMEAFRLALESGADGIEFDVRMTKDDIPVVIHDSTLDRTTYGKGYVKDYEYDKIKNIKTRNDEHIPSLSEVIDLIKNENKLMFIEIKDREGFEKVVDMIFDKGVEKITFLISFWHDIMKIVRDSNPEIRTGLIFVGRPANVISLLDNTKADMINVNYQFIDRGMIVESHKNKTRIGVWSVNEIQTAKNLVEMGVDYIFTDFPDKIKKILKSS